MATLTLRNVPEETRQALIARAQAAHRSMEAEARLILELAVRPPERLRLGSLLAEIGNGVGRIDLDSVRGTAASDPVSFD
ncbi:MAG: hypothetical protein LBJ62_03420 [Bifidobacteriaceae bacterium]|jgi:plasmid stability protein|nr:hypothetical protein [Bifidobacteriaceae bacterium]